MLTFAKLETQVPRLAELCRGSKYFSILTNDFERYGEMISSNPVFFPDYTDHGIEHFWAVLRSASSLIHDETWPKLTHNDAVALVLATFFHDLGMHLTKDVFLTLVDSSEDNPYKPILTQSNFISKQQLDRPWSHLWHEFISNLKHLDQNKLSNMVGEDRKDSVRLIEMNEWKTPNKWDSVHLRCIGDFLRQHHGRLAHDIVVYGFPTHNFGKTTNPIHTPIDVKEKVANLIGLVARSHAYGLQEMSDYLKFEGVLKKEQTYQGIHPVFLMGLLRISDYLHITAERASKEIMQIKTLTSPLSMQEWQSHQAIEEIQISSRDSESIFIRVTPKDAKTYIDLKKKLSGLQSELDKTWGVLAEEYTNNFKMAIRRIQSDIDSHNYDFIPAEARFHISKGNILNLLSKKLYGDNPLIAIRELLQNSIDAINARKAIDKKFHGKVDVSLKKMADGSWNLEISDNGMGMSKDIILNYFLSVGGSFRESDEWQEKFASQKTLRSGRFGIGVLAGFLVGDELDVTSKQFNYFNTDTPRGICFKAKIDSELIELKLIDACEVGTVIKITLDKKYENKVFSAFENYIKHGLESRENPLPYYFLDQPLVNFSIQDGNNRSRDNRNGIHYRKNKLPPKGWRRAKVRGFSDILWSSGTNNDGLLNGILIGQYFKWFLYPVSLLGELQIKIMFFDPNAILDIEVDRSSVFTVLPEEIRKGIIESIIKNCFIALLMLPPEKMSFFDSSFFAMYLSGYDCSLFPMTNEGYVLSWQNKLSKGIGMVLAEPEDHNLRFATLAKNAAENFPQELSSLPFFWVTCRGSSYQSGDHSKFFNKLGDIFNIDKKTKYEYIAQEQGESDKKKFCYFPFNKNKTDGIPPQYERVIKWGENIEHLEEESKKSHRSHLCAYYWFDSLALAHKSQDTDFFWSVWAKLCNDFLGPNGILPFDDNKRKEIIENIKNNCNDKLMKEYIECFNQETRHDFFDRKDQE